MAQIYFKTFPTHATVKNLTEYLEKLDSLPQASSFPWLMGLGVWPSFLGHTPVWELWSISEWTRAAVAGAGSTDLPVVGRVATPPYLDLKSSPKCLVVAASEAKSP